MSDTFATYLQNGFLDFEKCCVSDPAEELLKLEPIHGSMLDLASGHAPYLGILKGYSELTLLDRSPLLLDEARETAEKLGLKNINYVNSHSEKIPFAADTFDIILCSFALCDVHDWRETMSEVERVIKPGGDFILIDCVGGNNDFLYDMVQIADVLDGAEIGRESAEIWCYLINYLQTKAKLLKHEEFKLIYEFPDLNFAKELSEGVEIRMKGNSDIKKAIHAYLEKLNGRYEIDSVYLKMNIHKGTDVRDNI